MAQVLVLGVGFRFPAGEDPDLRDPQRLWLVQRMGWEALVVHPPLGGTPAKNGRLLYSKLLCKMVGKC